MTRRTPIASLVAVIAALGFVGPPEHVLADGMKVTSNDATARFLSLAVGKSVVIDLAADITQVLVADPSIAKVAVLTNRRILHHRCGARSNQYLFL